MHLREGSGPVSTKILHHLAFVNRIRPEGRDSLAEDAESAGRAPRLCALHGETLLRTAYRLGWVSDSADPQNPRAEVIDVALTRGFTQMVVERLRRSRFCQGAARRGGDAVPQRRTTVGSADPAQSRQCNDRLRRVGTQDRAARQEPPPHAFQTGQPEHGQPRRDPRGAPRGARRGA